PMTVRRRNFGVRRVCGGGRSRWPKCGHGWHFSYKPHRARGIGSPRTRATRAMLRLDMAQLRFWDSASERDWVRRRLKTFVLTFWSFELGLAFDGAALQATAFYGAIREWEANNAGWQILA